MPENHYNCETILNALNITFIEECTINADQKLINIIVGMQSPSGSTHPCYGCRANKLLCKIGTGMFFYKSHLCAPIISNSIDYFISENQHSYTEFHMWLDLPNKFLQIPISVLKC